MDIELLCTDCDKVVLFEVPVCDDARDGDLMCVVCGTAVTVSGLLVADVALAA